VSCADVSCRLRRAALFDRTLYYRYTLTRAWDPGLPAVAFVMLNPSTADARRDDPTIRRCINLARAWGFGSMCAVNLFAFRATHPADLRAAPDPVGPANDRHLLRVCSAADQTIVAWGVHGSFRRRDAQVLDLIARCCRPRCLGLTKAGLPRHPLMIPRAVRPRLFTP
jgi:hypothetical protein